MFKQSKKPITNKYHASNWCLLSYTAHRSLLKIQLDLLTSLLYLPEPILRVSSLVNSIQISSPYIVSPVPVSSLFIITVRLPLAFYSAVLAVFICCFFSLRAKLACRREQLSK
jgi:hypothetical protein